MTTWHLPRRLHRPRAVRAYVMRGNEVVMRETVRLTGCDSLELASPDPAHPWTVLLTEVTP